MLYVNTKSRFDEYLSENMFIYMGVKDQRSPTYLLAGQFFNSCVALFRFKICEKKQFKHNGSLWKNIYISFQNHLAEQDRGPIHDLHSQVAMGR